MNRKQNKQHEREEREARLQQSLRDNLRRRKSQVKQRDNLDDADAPLPREGRIGVSKMDDDTKTD